MKYINILAGAIGLMALAACSSVIEQPKALSTITVAYNQGPATRSTISPDPAASGGLYKYTNGIKVSWESGDQIALIKDGTTYTYETQDEGEVATFTLVSGTAPTAEGEYKVVFPGGWDGNLTDFATQDLYAFTPTNYLYATGTATFTDGAFDETVTLTPVFSFIFIDEGVAFKNMEYWEYEGYLDFENEDYLFTYTFDLQGTNLFSSIEDFEGKSSSAIHLTNFSSYCYVPSGETNPYEYRWSTDGPRMIAIPVFADKPITNLYFTADGVACNIYNSEGDPLTIAKGGLIVYIDTEDDHLVFPAPK